MLDSLCGPITSYIKRITLCSGSADDICIYTTDHKEGYVLRKLQRGLSANETWCERSNIKFNEDSDHIFFS
jgi:hypothetical protein